MKQKKFCIKNIIVKLISCIMVSFLVITSYIIPKKENYIVHADTYTPVQKQSFVTWLLSYFGINIYTDAQQISDNLYTAVKLAYDAYLATLQPQQQIEFDDIADLVTWDNAKPNVLKLPGTVYNVLKGFANYISSQVYDPTDVNGLEIGSFEIDGEELYYNNLYNGLKFKQGTGGWGSNWAWSDNNNVRIVFTTNGNSTWYHYVYNQPGAKWILSSSATRPNSISNNIARTIDVNGVTYYYSSGSEEHGYAVVDVISGINRQLTASEMVYYTYGIGGTGEATLNDVYALPKPAVLDDLIGAADPEEDMQLDLNGSDIAYSTALTLEDIIGMINDAVNGYVLDDSYPDTASKIAAQSQAIDNELTDVDYPNASTWEVPQPIATPQIIPLIQPDCPDLSACLVAGIQDVGQSLGNVIDANSNVSNYVSVILFMGIALAILGGI